tara:strand:- start:55 stop:255 length:201 start_codon:yes stop_codon:yes gene_type:complete
MKIKIEELRSLVHKVVLEAAKEGAFQKYAKSTYNKMIDKVSTGNNDNTPPFTKRASKAGKSGPPQE